jgi:nucleoside-diphosphate-sugar epimerase
VSESSGAILLTGPTGVVGEVLWPRLDPERLVCLTHSTELAGADPRVRVLRGDVGKPRLGLDEDTYARLADELSVIVNSAAMTRFDARREDVFAVNVEGARHVCQLAADAGARLVQVSTAFYAAKVAESGRAVTPKPYIDSKLAGEQVVRESGVDFHIARPSLVIGSVEGGEAARMQGYHFFVRELLRGNLPLIPVSDEAVIDFVSADLVADVVAAMAERRPPGEESWITAGPDAWYVPNWVSATIARARELGREVEEPRIVAPDVVDRLLRPVFFAELPRRTVRRFDQISGFSAALVSERPFPSSLAELERHYGREFPLELERTFRASTDFLVETLEPQVAQA